MLLVLIVEVENTWVAYPHAIPARHKTVRREFDSKYVHRVYYVTGVCF